MVVHPAGPQRQGHAPRLNQATEGALGGGCDQGWPAQIKVERPTNSQKPIDPTQSIAFVTRKYSAIPAANIAPSKARVAGIEFHSPRPNFGESPGQSGKSGRCETKSSSQWLTTSMRASIEILAVPLRSCTAAKATNAQASAMIKLCVHGYDSKARGVNLVLPGSTATRSTPN